MHPVYHAKITVSTKNFPRSQGDEVPGGPLIDCSGAFDENCPGTYPQFPPWEWTLAVEILVSVEFTTLDGEVQILRIYPSISGQSAHSFFVASKYCESTMHPVYHAKITVSTKNFPRSEGRKCGVKDLDQWHGLTAGKGRVVAFKILRICIVQNAL
jgi:hypothetical protein